MIVRDDEYLDFSKVPESRGVPTMVYYVAVIGIVGIFAVGAASIFSSGYGHHWPANTTLRTDLGTLHQ
ncbi:MAG: hypothetical protein JO029_14930 [Candidatus Eremiobacteraeota bacterium]|nr:hypothetical protein [Candidatus Eremiobacteraeota bacterium]MBV8284580.1 hypothetical protein [Candidatus Eremiobacteraeota bacterium]MBV8435571.1 hypothetical protein [Candidatus Eremiobacteraeota bacterium]MBV8722082.1 hypothetical protein [Candidatus Eremiobacteraeota bacterium]